MSFDLLTFAFEVINFVVLWWILARVLYRPLQKAVRNRREATAELKRLAAESRDQAGRLEEEAGSKLAEIEFERDRLWAEMEDEGQKKANRLLEDAATEIGEMRTRAEASRTREREVERVQHEKDAIALATDLAGKLLVRWAPDDADRVLLDALLRALESNLNSEDRIEEKDTPARLVLARPGALNAAMKATLIAILGDSRRLDIDEDASLVAGGTLDVGALFLDASLKGHLDGLRQETAALLRRPVGAPEDAHAGA